MAHARASLHPPHGQGGWGGADSPVNTMHPARLRRDKDPMDHDMLPDPALPTQLQTSAPANKTLIARYPPMGVDSKTRVHGIWVRPISVGSYPGVFPPLIQLHPLNLLLHIPD